MNTTTDSTSNQPKPARRPPAVLRWLRSIPIRTWIALVIFAVALTFVLQNRDNTTIYLFNVAVTAPLWTTLLITLAVGILVGLLTRRRHRDRKRSRQ
jgi:uncharacterized integral membrane protein